MVEVGADLVGNGQHFRRINAHANQRHMRGAHADRLFILGGNEAEIGVKGLLDIVLERGRPRPHIAKARAEAIGRILGDRLEDFFLGLEVIVECPGSEVGLADNVAHGGRIESDARKHPAPGAQDGPAIGRLGTGALAGCGE